MSLSQGEKLRLLANILSLYIDIQRISSDFRSVWQDTRRGSKLDHVVGRSYDGIAHSSHIGGFMAGLTVYLMYRQCLRWYYRRQMNYNSYQYNNNQGYGHHQRSNTQEDIYRRILNRD